jgi:hypothetical protein
MNTPVVDILLSYPPDSAAAIEAAQRVQVACDPFWVRGHGRASRTPGSVVLAIAAAGWPDVAAAIREARRTAGDGFSVSVTSADLSPDEVLEHPTF